MRKNNVLMGTVKELKSKPCDAQQKDVDDIKAAVDNMVDVVMEAGRADKRLRILMVLGGYVEVCGQLFKNDGGEVHSLDTAEYYIKELRRSLEVKDASEN